jgi:hypothetical protein
MKLTTVSEVMRHTPALGKQMVICTLIVSGSPGQDVILKKLHPVSMPGKTYSGKECLLLTIEYFTNTKSAAYETNVYYRFPGFSDTGAPSECAFPGPCIHAGCNPAGR